MFRSIPTIATADELLEVAFRRASRVPAAGRRGIEGARAEATAKLSGVGDRLGATLGRYVRAFPNLEGLPPFYGELVDLLVGRDPLRHHLGSVEWARRRVGEIVGAGRRAVGRARTRREVGLAVREAYGRIASVVHQVGEALAFLADARRELRRLPDVDPALPTVVVAGAPNVGKSQLVRQLSTARPRVAPFPFTTQRITLGHFPHAGGRVQVIDTPGLLDRPTEERNPMERQAIAALRHLAHVIAFVVDPTGTCGFPLPYQEQLLAEVRRAFPGVPVVVVSNKADLGGPRGPGVAVSALTGRGVAALRRALARRATSRAPAAAPPWEAAPRRGPA